MPLLDRKQDAWPSLAEPSALPPSRDDKAPLPEAFAPIKAIAEKFGPEGLTAEEHAGQYRLIVPKSKLVDILTFLKHDPDLRFDYLMDVHGQDYLHFRGAKHRFCVVYHVLSHKFNLRLWLKVMLDEPDLKLPSVQPIWKGADWMEREIYDMFGIIFEGHPDLRRILMPKGFADHPLRKDYPLTGKGERHDFEPVDREDA